MKQQNLLTKMLLLFALIIGSVSSVWADDIYVKVSTATDLVTDGSTEYILGYTNNTTAYVAGIWNSNKFTKIELSASGDEITVPTNSTATVFVLGGSSTDGYTIQISEGNYIVYDSGTKLKQEETVNSDNGKWTIAENSTYSKYTITNKGTTNRYLGRNDNNMTAYSTTNMGTYPPLTLYKKKISSPLKSITISGTYPIYFYQGNTFEIGQMIVTASYEDNSTKNVTSSAIFSGYDMTATGAQTVTVSYTENSITKTATYDITVNERPKFTITFSDGGSITEETSGAGVTLPSRPNTLDYTFEGWSETEVASETTTVPNVISVGVYYPIGNITLYPIYKRTDGGIREVESEVTISEYATEHNWSSQQYSTVSIDNMITATASSGQYTGTYTSNSWKIYQTDGGTVTITAAEGCNMTSITFTFTKSNSGTLNYGTEVLTSGTACTISGRSAVFEVKKSGTGTNGQILITKINVAYTKNKLYFTSNPVSSLSITPAYEYISFSTTRGLDFTDVEGLTAFVVSTDNGTSVKLTEVKKVPANTGIVLKKTGTDADYSVPVLNGEADSFTNLLIGTADGPKEVTARTVYVLNSGQFKLFTGTTIPQGKAYLPSNGDAPALDLDFGEGTTGIQNIERTISDDQYYTLDGRRVAQPTKGLYILNGKKVILK